MFYIHDYDTLEVRLHFNEVGFLGYELNKEKYIFLSLSLYTIHFVYYISYMCVYVYIYTIYKAN